MKYLYLFTKLNWVAISKGDISIVDMFKTFVRKSLNWNNNFAFVITSELPELQNVTDGNSTFFTDSAALKKFKFQNMNPPQGKILEKNWILEFIFTLQKNFLKISFIRFQSFVCFLIYNHIN
jgi:hypothetical protein